MEGNLIFRAGSVLFIVEYLYKNGMGDFLLELFSSLVVDIVLVPLKLILATPVILVMSLFGGGDMWQTLRSIIGNCGIGIGHI